jgi:hypothetical protein
VTITGTGFTGATAVDFGSAAAASFTVNSATSITATSPAATTVGPVDITVTTPAGTSTTSPADQFSHTYPFTGFSSPVANPPTLNQVNGGQAIPMKWSLGADYGLGILASGSPTVRQVTCSTGVPVNTATLTDTAGCSGLQDNGGGSYTYVWKTLKAWALLAATLPADATRQCEHEPTELTKRLERIDAAENAHAREIEHLATLPPDSPAVAALRTRILARFSELENERTNINAKLDQITAAAPAVSDPGLLNRLPQVPGILHHAPDELQQELYRLFGAQMINSSSPSTNYGSTVQTGLGLSQSGSMTARSPTSTSAAAAAWTTFSLPTCSAITTSATPTAWPKPSSASWAKTPPQASRAQSRRGYRPAQAGGPGGGPVATAADLAVLTFAP